MPKVVGWGSDAVDADLIDEAENEEREGFEPYEGPMPPKGSILRCEVKQVIRKTFESGNKGVRVLLVVKDPAKPQYDGLTYWENIVNTEANAWKIRQWMDAIGSKAAGEDWNKPSVEEQDNNEVVVKFGKIRMEGAFVRVQHKTGRYQGEPKPEVGRFMIHDAAKLAATKAKAGKGSKASSKADSDEEGEDSEPPF